MQVKLRLLFKKVHQHMLWRILIGLMACIGCITTVVALWNDILIPVFRPSQEIRHEMELEDLLALFIPSDGKRGLEWTIGASPDSPIVWTTAERYGNVPNRVFLNRFSAARHGKITVMIRGKPSHEQFDETIHPALWDVNMYGYMAGPRCVQFVARGSSYNERPDVIASIAHHVQLKDTHPKSANTFVGNLYRISFEGKHASWLVEEWSIGNHSWFLEFTLFPGEDSLPLAKEFLDSLLTRSN